MKYKALLVDFWKQEKIKIRPNEEKQIKKYKHMIILTSATVTGRD